MCKYYILWHGGNNSTKTREMKGEGKWKSSITGQHCAGDSRVSKEKDEWALNREGETKSGGGHSVENILGKIY